MISKIYHIADVHIRLVRRHKEYKEVFDRLFDYIQKTKDENSVIYLGGDIVHNKVELSPELIDLTVYFLRNCADLCPTILIAGNHDCNLNSTRMDSLAPLVNAMKHPNLHYWKDTGVYELNGVGFSVFSVFDPPELWIPASKLQQNIKIALHHGSITGAFTDVAHEIKTGINLDHFAGFDLGLLGDIHRPQFMDIGSRVAYCGSLIQQDHGESHDNHGIMVWDLTTFKSQFIPIWNNYAYYTLEFNDGAYELPANLPPNLRLRIKHYGNHVGEFSNMLTELGKRHNIMEMVKMRSTNLQFGQNGANTLALGDSRRLDYQNQMIGQVLEQMEIRVTPEEINDVFELNRHINGLMATSTARRSVIWNPIKLEFENMFSYGSNNSIDFANMAGLIGLFEPNVSGKSSIFDILCFALFDKTTRTSIASHILNHSKSNFKCKIEFEINNQIYFIERIGTKKKDGAVRVDVNFWTVDESGAIVNLNGEDRDKTNQQIRNHIGMYDDYVMTGFSSQYDNQSFVEKTQKDRKELLYKFLDIQIYDELLKIAKERGRDCQTMLRSYKPEELHQESSRIYAQIGLQRDNLDKAEQILADKKECLKTQMTGISELYKLLNADAVEPLDLGKIETEIANANRKQNDINERIGQITHQTTDLKNEFVQNSNLLSALVIDGNKDTLTNLQRENTTRITKITTELKKYEHQLKHCTLQRDRLSTHQYDPNCQYCTNSEFVKAAMSDVKLIDTLLADVDTMRLQVKSIDVENAEIVKKLSVHQEHEKLMSRQEAIKTNVQTNDERVKVFEYELKTLQELCNNLNSKREEYFKNKTRLDQNAKTRAQIEQLTSEISNMEHEIEQLEGQLRKELVALEKLNSKYESVCEKIQQYSEYAKLSRTYELYQMAVGRDGVPYKILETVVPVIESEVNQILNSVVDFTVSLTAGTDKYISANIVYSDHKTWPVELTSGMERFILSLAFRTCLAELTNLPKSNFLVIDEGFGVLDNDNIMAISNLFTYLKERHNFIICVSHLDTMRDMVDGHLKIGKLDDYSHIVA